MGLLYEAEQKNQPVADILTELPTDPDPFAVDLATGADERRDAIDQLLGRYAKGWAVDRMPATDRAILRMAVLRTRGASRRAHRRHHQRGGGAGG